MSNKRLGLFVLISLFIMVTAIAGFTHLAQDPALDKRRKIVDEFQFPIVEQSAPEPDDAEKRARRRAIGKRFSSDSILTPLPTFRIAARVTHWPEGFSSIPVDHSDVVLIGEVTKAKAYISTDKTAVYSEFAVSPIQILKNDGLQKIDLKSHLSVTRYGGRVRYPDGSTQLLYSTGLGMPQIGGQYMFFLKKVGYDFDLLTGYELSGGRVNPLDTGSPNFAAHANREAHEFVSFVSGEINKLHR